VPSTGLATPQTWCDNSSITLGAYLALPYDGPVDSVTLEYSGSNLALLTDCATAQPTSCGAAGSWKTTFTAVPAGARIFLSYTAGTSADLLQSTYPDVLISAASLGTGTSCDPSSTTAVCTSGVCADDGTGTSHNRCQ
jgi:hypothetical protein